MKEFKFSSNGAYAAIGTSEFDKKIKREVCVVRVSDGFRFDVSGVPYGFGGGKLAINAESHTLFSGDDTGIAAYDFESGDLVWLRRDLKGLGYLAYDSFEGVVYCRFERRTTLLTASNGLERAYFRHLNDFFFSRDSGLAVFESGDVKLQNRATNVAHVLARKNPNVLRVAFAASAAVISWVSGPVTSYDTETGQLLWTYQPEGTHAYSVVPSSDNASVWVKENPKKDPPPHRLRLLSNTGEIKQEVRFAFGHFDIVPFSDSIIGADFSITPIGALAGR